MAQPPSAGDATHVRPVLSRFAGVLRDAHGLAEAADALRAQNSDASLLGLMMVTAMQRRTESRGGHARTDFPHRDPAQGRRKRHTHTLELIPA